LGEQDEGEADDTMPSLTSVNRLLVYYIVQSSEPNVIDCLHIGRLHVISTPLYLR